MTAISGPIKAVTGGDDTFNRKPLVPAFTLILLGNGAQKRTRTSTPFRVPAPEAGASTNSAIWATESHVRGWPPTVNWLFEVFLTVGKKDCDDPRRTAFTAN